MAFKGIQKSALLAASIFLVACGGKTSASSNGSDSTSHNPILSNSSEVPTASYSTIYETTGNKSHILDRISDKQWQDYSFSGDNEIHLDTTTKKSELEGYGAAMTHSSAYLLETMDATLKQEALETLFGDSGARLNCVRIPIGTSDYTNTSTFYSLDDTDGTKDYDLAQFSTSKDEEYLIPALQDVLKVNPSVTFLAVPWSAPAWMKSNSSLVGGKLIEGSDSSPSNEEIAFAAYLTKFVTAYHAKGIDIAYLGIENEPTTSGLSYPCMNVSANQWARLVRLTSRDLKKAGMTSTKILAYDHNVGDSSGNILFGQFADEVSADSEVSAAVGAFGLHCYSSGWQTNHTSFLQEQVPLFPNQKFFVTEVTESQSSGVDFAQNMSWSMQNVTVGPEAAGASMSLYWNLVLTDQGKPVKGNSAVCYGVLTYKDGKIYKNPAYYSMAHISQFAYAIAGQKPVQLDSYADNEAKINTTSYLRADGTIVTVVANVDATTYEDVALVKDGTQMIRFRLQPQSAITILSEKEHSDHYASIEPSSIVLTMASNSSYDVVYKGTSSEATAFYFCLEGASYTESDKIASTYSGGAFHFHLDKVPGDYSLHAVDGATQGTFNLTLPNFSPSATTQTSGKVLIDFGFDKSTSWSSYCDPYGKAIYRSASNVYDANAKQVNLTTSGAVDPIYITTENYTDNNPSDSAYIYFLVLTAKSGIVTFVSYPLISEERVFASKSADLLLKGNVPTLEVQVKPSLASELTAYALRIKDVNGESYSIPNSGTAAAFVFDFNLSQLSKTSVWYDIEIVSASSQTAYSLAKSDAVDFSKTLSSGTSSWNFQEWEGILKINRVA